MRKQISVIILTLALLLTCPSLALAEDDFSLDCKSAILMDGNSGEVLFEQDSDLQCYPASVTKIMTMVLILEAVEDGHISLEDKVTVSDAAASMGGSQVYLYPGEVRTVDEMLVAIAVGSGNDAAYAMAEFVGGTYDNFISMMNDKATELGMLGSHFMNPHGLHDENHYTTAADLGKLAYHALYVPYFLDYTSIYEYEFRSSPLLTLWNTNRLLKWYEGTDGMKTGYTEQAGRNLVATVERDGMRLISVVLGCEERQSHFKRSMELLNYGFNSFSAFTIHEAGEVVSEIEVSKGTSDTVRIIIPQAIAYSALKGKPSDINEILNLPNAVDAPVKAGDVLGSITIYRDGLQWQSFDLVAETDVERGGLWRTWKKLLRHIW